MEKPASAEFRALPSIGVVGMLQLAQWATSAPDQKLWSNRLFDGVFILLTLVTLYGIWGFFQHWKLRALAPAIIVVIYGLVCFGQPPTYILLALACAFIVIAYFVSPDRVLQVPIAVSPELLMEAAREAENAGIRDKMEKIIRERDNALRELDDLRTRSSAESKKALLEGTIKQFESLNMTDVHQFYADDLRRDLGREPTFTESMVSALDRPQEPWYVAWLQMQTSGTASRAKNWSFTVNHKDGAELPCELVAKQWSAPKKWHDIPYSSIVEIQNMFLQNNHVYNVLLHLRCSASEAQLNMRSFKARFLDDNDVEIVCSMQGVMSP